MIEREMRPALAAKARLKKDARSGRYLLLYPERGMELNATSAAIVQLCDGRTTVSDIIATLVSRYAATPPDVVEAEVLSFLGALRDRALIAQGSAASGGVAQGGAAGGGVARDGQP